MKKRILASLLAGAMALSMAACSGGKSAQSSAPESQAPAGESSAPAEEGGAEATGALSGDLLIWSWDVALNFLSEVSETFMEQNPDLNIQCEEMGTDQVYNKLTTSLASGSGLPDLVTIEGEQMPKFANKFPDSFVDLTERINKDDWLPIKLAEATDSRGKIVAYPWDAAPCMMFYRRDFYENAGVNPEEIKTWDQFIEAGKKITAANEGVAMVPLATSRRDHIYRIMLMQQNKFYFDDAGNSCMDTPESIGAMEMTKKIYDAGITVNDTSWDDYVTSIKEGKVASVPDGIWMAGTIKDLSPEDSGKWGVMDMPQYSESTTGEASNGGSVLAIPASTQNVEAAIAFAEYTLTDLENVSKGLEVALYPSYVPAFELDDFNATDDYFGGQNVLGMFKDIGGRIPQVNYTENFAEAYETNKNAVAKVLLENADVTTTMQDVQKEFVTKFGK